MNPRRWLRRLVAVGALSAALVGVTAGPASAHTVAGAGATNYHSRILSVTPKVAGLSVSVQENGNKLEVINHTGQQLIILGYSGEPYLRVTASGVDENLRSSATYLNETRFGTTPVPASADNKGVDWKHISSVPIAVWHDHRIHWNSTSLPPLIAASPGKRQHVLTWHVTMQLAAEPITVTGSLDWIPGPSPAPYYGLMLLLLVLAGALVWRLRRTCAPLLVVLTAVDVVHTLGVATDRARTSVVTGFGVYPVVDVVWVVALVAAALVARRRRLGWQLLIPTAAWMTIVGGLAEFSAFSHSSAPFSWPLVVERICTAVEAPLGVVLVAAGVIALWPTRHASPEPGASEEPVAAPG